MDNLRKYERVNDCETAQALADAIRSFADSDGMIQGRTRKFDAERMANAVIEVCKGMIMPNALTREFGIRQQAMYLKYYYFD